MQSRATKNLMQHDRVEQGTSLDEEPRRCAARCKDRRRRHGAAPSRRFSYQETP
jgi:hypothetical protein